MSRRGFTMVELLVSIFILGFISTLSFMLYSTVSESWVTATDYIDRMQRSDYALEQVVSGLRSMYYPHAGQQDENYGFYLSDNGDGDDPRSSDVIEWAKVGSAIVGNKDSAVDTVHRVQLMILEEGNRDYQEPIEVTGLYARMCPDPALRPQRDKNVREKDYSMGNQDLYQPVLVAEGVVGFNCRVMKSPDDADGDVSKATFEDTWATSNTVPYKVQMTFWVADPGEKSYRTNTSPIMRIVRIPVYEQSQDGASLPSEDAKGAAGARPNGPGGAGGTGAGVRPGGGTRPGGGMVPGAAGGPAGPGGPGAPGGGPMG